MRISHLRRFHSSVGFRCAECGRLHLFIDIKVGKSRVLRMNCRCDMFGFPIHNSLCISNEVPFVNYTIIDPRGNKNIHELKIEVINYSLLILTNYNDFILK